MKFKYVGVSEFRDLDLVLEGVMSEKDLLLPNTIIEVSDTKRKLIRRLKINGNFEVVNETPKVPRKSSKKKQNKRKNDKEDNIDG